MPGTRPGMEIWDESSDLMGPEFTDDAFARVLLVQLAHTQCSHGGTHGTST